MKLVNELAIEASLEEVWRALQDVPLVARALPGAGLEPEPAGGVYRGTMKVKVGPVNVEYRGVARLDEVDEDEHVASYWVHGRETHGHGEASVGIRVRASARGSATHVDVETDLQVSGRLAQLGRGAIEEIAAAIIAEFAGRLEEVLSGTAVVADEHAEPWDAGSALISVALERGAYVVGGMVVGLALGRLVWRRR